jgi:hypothetical protein
MEHNSPDDRIVQSPQANTSPTLLMKTNAVVMFRTIHTWIKQHPLPPKVLMTPDWNIARLLCDFDDATITKISNSVQLVASTLTLYRCWLLVQESPQVMEVPLQDASSPASFALLLLRQVQRLLRPKRVILYLM